MSQVCKYAHVPVYSKQSEQPLLQQSLQQHSLLEFFPAIDIFWKLKLTQVENVILPALDTTYQSPASHFRSLQIRCFVKKRKIALLVVFFFLLLGRGTSFCATHQTISWSMTWTCFLLIPHISCFRPGLVRQCPVHQNKLKLCLHCFGAVVSNVGLQIRFLRLVHLRESRSTRFEQWLNSFCYETTDHLQQFRACK